MQKMNLGIKGEIILVIKRLHEQKGTKLVFVKNKLCENMIITWK